LLLAPALLIIAMKQNSILNAKTGKEIIEVYNEGCGINYNPNTVIEMLNSLIDDIFVLEGK